MSTVLDLEIIPTEGDSVEVLNQPLVDSVSGTPLTLLHSGPEWSFLVKMKIEISKFSGQFIVEMERSDMF